MNEKQLQDDINKRAAELEKREQDSFKAPLVWEIVKSAILNARISALAIIIAKKHEAISNKLISLTWALLVLTGVLCLLTLALLGTEVIPKDSIAHNERKPTTNERQQTNQNYQVVIPAVTNR
jgi:hypothetical protein